MRKWNIGFLAVSVVAAALSPAIGSAQETDEKFGKIDQFLEKQSSLLEQSQNDPSAEEKKQGDEPISNQTTQQKANETTPKGRDRTPSEKTLLMETPPSSQFIFNRDVYLSANKQGKFFAGPNAVYDISESASEKAIAELLNKNEGSACALLSNKSNIMMRGDDSSGKPPTFLEVSKVRLKKYPEGGIYSISFESKKPKNVEQDAAINITVMCSLPESKKDEPKAFDLGDVNDAFGGLFNFKISMYIEI